MEKSFIFKTVLFLYAILALSSVVQATEIIGNIIIPARSGQTAQDIKLVKDKAAYDAAGIKYPLWVSDSDMHTREGRNPGNYILIIKSKRAIHKTSRQSFIIKANNNFYMVDGKAGAFRDMPSPQADRMHELTGVLNNQKNQIATLKNKLSHAYTRIHQGEEDLNAIRSEKKARIGQLKRTNSALSTELQQNEKKARKGMKEEKKLQVLQELKRTEMAGRLAEERKKHELVEGALKAANKEAEDLKHRIHTTEAEKKQQEKTIANLRAKSKKMEVAISTFAFRLARQDEVLRKVSENIVNITKRSERKKQAAKVKQTVVKIKPAPSTSVVLTATIKNSASCKKGESEGWWVRHGDTVHSTMKRWAERAGWIVVWESQYRRTMVANACFSNDFTAAVKELIRTIGNSKNPIRGEFYKNHVLRVTDLEAAK